MMAMEKEESMSPYWLSSTNWLVAGGSLEGSISFVTSSTNGGDPIPIGVLLEKPADSSPCEITIVFRERHDLHSIYVRSSARVYEVYYASDSKVSSNEYLCTVRCGAALQEVTQDMCERVLAEGMVPNDINADFPRSNSNNVMEDGWVEVEVPYSLPPDNGKPSMSNISEENICPKTQIQYEATAEISDASPCMSITLRLLSLQLKTSVHIDEIYIYADPVEDTDPDPPVSNVGAGCLLSMLVPSFLQISKSGTSGLQHKGFSDELAGPKYLSSAEGTMHAAFPEKFEMSEVAASSMMGNSEVGRLDQQDNKEKLEHPLVESSKIVSDPDQASETKPHENNGVRSCHENTLDEPVVRHTQTKPGDGKLRLTEEEKGLNQSQMAINNETNSPYVLEKILDDLVSRMGKLENFCISFQESILKPLTGIEMRLERIEEQLDAFSKAPQSSETYSSTRTSRLSVQESSFENEGCKSSSAAVDSSSHEKEASIDLLMVSSLESEISGLVNNAPEFLYDDDDDDFNIGYSVDLTPNEYSKSDKCVSIDIAFASALAAFVKSTTDISSPNNSHPMNVPNEQHNRDDHFLDSAAVTVHSGTDRDSLPELFLGDKNGDGMYDARDEFCQSEQSCSDIVDPDSTLNKFDMIDRTGEKLHGNYLCDDSLLVDDDSSAETEAHESSGLIIIAAEFPNEDDIIDCGESPEPHVSNYPTPLAFYLSSRKLIPSRSSSNSHEDPLELSTSDRNSFSLTTCQTHGGSDGMRTSNLTNYVNTAVESSLVGCFLSQDGSLQQLDIFRDTAVIEEENSSFIRHIMEDANHVLKCDGLHFNGMSKGYNITQNLLANNQLHTDRSCSPIQDKDYWVGDSEVRTAKGPVLDLLGKFKEADSSAPSGFDFDDIFMKSELHPEYYDSNDMDFSIGAFVLTGQNGGPTTGNSGSYETIVQCQSRDGTIQMNPLFEPKQMSSLVPCQDDVTTTVKFCADENLKSWLPLEILLDEKHDDDRKKNDPLKLVQEYSVSNLELSVYRNLGSGQPLDKIPDDLGENSDYGIEEYNKQHNSPPAQGFSHHCEIADNTLIDIEDDVVQFEISSMVPAGTPHLSVWLSSGNPFSSLI